MWWRSQGLSADQAKQKVKEQRGKIKMTNTFYHVDSEVFETIPAHSGRVTKVQTEKDFDSFYTDFHNAKADGLSDIDAINDAK